MSSFDYMNFNDGCTDIEFVAHAKKFTKEQAIELFIEENGWRIEKKQLREPIIDDINQRYVKYYVSAPDWCSYDGDGGCYTYSNKGARGAFPVWVIEFGRIETELK